MHLTLALLEQSSSTPPKEGDANVLAVWPLDLG